MNIRRGGGRQRETNTDPYKTERADKKVCEDRQKETCTMREGLTFYQR